MLGCRQTRWANIKSILCQRLEFTNNVSHSITDRAFAHLAGIIPYKICCYFITHFKTHNKGEFNLLYEAHCTLILKYITKSCVTYCINTVAHNWYVATGIIVKASIYTAISSPR